MTVWQFGEMLMNRLMQWAGYSVFAGVVLLPRDRFWRAFGLQAIAWGLIDAAIAYYGGRGMRERSAQPNADQPETRAKEAKNLRLLLLVNAGLDLLYMRFGRQMADHAGRDAFKRGTGWGIVAQGMFLFFFDLFHAIGVPETGENDQEKELA
jgi:hypothetical protein